MKYFSNITKHKSSALLVFCSFVCAMIFAFAPQGVNADTVTLESDTFSGTTINSAKWTEVDSVANGIGGTAGNVQQNGFLRMTSNNSWGSNALRTVRTFDRTAGDIAIEVDAMSNNCAAAHTLFGVGYGDKDLLQNSYIFSQYNGLGRLSTYGDITQSSDATTFTCTNNVPFHIKLVILKDGGAKLFLNRSTTAAANTTRGTANNLPVYLETYSGTSTVTYTNFTVTQSTAPTITGLSGTYVNHILSTGQELSQGYAGSPALSRTQPYNNVMLSASSLVPLVEAGVETMSSGLANWMTAAAQGNFQVAVTRHGVNSTTYSGLKKGTAAFTSAMSQVTKVKNAAVAKGQFDRVIAVTAIHGESDLQAGTPQSSYEANLVAWQRDYETDAKAITGQTTAIPLFIDQLSSQTGLNSVSSSIPLAQLAAAENNPSKIYLVAPKYFLNYADGSRLTNSSYRWLGEYYGKVIRKVVTDGRQWVPLSPASIIRSGNTIYAKFNVPVGSLVLDTSLVAARTNYGFKYSDDSNSAIITNVSILNSDTVKITLSAVPTGANQKLGYAITGIAGTNPGAQNSSAIGGNLRDSDSTASLNGSSLYNWAVQFNKPVINDSTGPVASSIAAGAITTTSAIITWTTNELSNTRVHYGRTSTYTNYSELNSTTLDTAHGMSLTGLTPGTTYHYQIFSTDAIGNTASSSDYTFTTLGQGTGSSNNASSNNSIYGSDYYTGSGAGSYFSYATSSSSNVGAATGEPGCTNGAWFSIYTGRACTTTSTGQSSLSNGSYGSYGSYGGSSTGQSGSFTKNLSIGMTDGEVLLLQRFLNQKGFIISTSGSGSPGNETNYFGNATKAALVRYQAANSISPASGYFGPLTRAYISSHPY